MTDPIFTAAAITPNIILTQSAGNTAVTEGGTTDSYTLVLSSKPSANVTITLDNTNNQVDVDTVTLIFTPDDWFSPQTVTVNAVNDSMGEGLHKGVIKHTVSSTDLSYNGMVVSAVQVAITDNDLPVVSRTLFASAVLDPFGLTDVNHYSNPVLVDIDGDGDLDLFSGQEYGDVKFFRNTGSASAPHFTAEASNFGLANVGKYPRPSFADIDGDGDQDAFVGAGSGNTTFFRNTGSATAPNFVAEASNFGLPDVGQSASPTFADIDGDGDLDAFVGNHVHDVLFFRNTGSVTAPAFTAEGTLFSSSLINASASPTFADIDGDGDLDALVGARNGKTIFFRNTGSAISPNFVYDSNDAKLGSVTSYAKPVLADLDGDGDLDVLVGNSGGGFYFFRNDPSLPAIITNQSGSSTEVTEGGATDSYTLVLNTQPSANVTITLESIGNQVSFGANTITFTPSNWNQPQTVTVTAIDDAVWESPQHSDTIKQTVTSGDGNYNGYALDSVSVTVTDNDRPVVDLPFITAAVTNPFSLADVGSASSPSFADMDGDGDLDAVVGRSDGHLLLFTNTGSKTAPNFAAPTDLADVGTFSTPTVVDIDGDGKKDIFVGRTSGDIVFLHNTGTATAPKFDAASTSTDPFGFANHSLRPPASFASFDSSAPSFVDIDGDGDLDAFVGLSYTALDGLFGLPLDTFGYVEFYRNTGTATAPNFVNEKVNFGLTYVGDGFIPTPMLGFVDIDGDGDQDAFVGDFNGNTTFYLNTGTKFQPSFGVPVTHFGLPNIGYGSDPTFADIDGDGDLDALVGDAYGNTLMFANNQKPTFTAFAGVVGSGAEDNTITITLTSLKAQGNEADKDAGGSVAGFVVTAVSSGTLKIGADAASATAWASGSNDTIDASHQAFWTPAANANGTLNAFTVIAKDNSGGVSSAAVQAQVAISAVNDAPTTSPITLAAIVEDSGVLLITQAQLLANANDVEGNTLVASGLTIASGNGTLVDNGNGTWNYTPAPNDDSSVSFSYTITDNGSTIGIANPKSVTGSATLDITPVNDAPKITGGNNDIVYYDSARDDIFSPYIRSNLSGTNLTALDPDGDAISFGVVGGIDNGDGTVTNTNTYGTLIVNKTTGNYTFTPNDAAIEPLSSNVTVLFTVTATDGIATGSQILAVFINQWGSTETVGNDILEGTINNDTFNGLAGNDTIYGGKGNDMIRGGMGADVMYGGSGNDTYRVDNVGDKVVETSTLASEKDWVYSTVNYTLPANVENLALVGVNAINATGNMRNNFMSGNAAANILTGNAGADTLFGNAGADTLFGGAGADKMRGGLGNDTYNVDNIRDKVIETSVLETEIDSVFSTVNYTLSANVENLTLIGTNKINGIGNSLTNTIIGNDAANILNGLGGNDILTGGLGNDIFKLTTLSTDTITDFSVIDDTIQLENGIFTQLTTTGMLSASNFAIGEATDVDDFILYDSATGILTYDSNGNGAGEETQIAVLSIGLALSNTDFVVI